MTYKLSPSDFGFIWEECKRCFYLRVKRGINRPSAPFPGIFSVIDSRMKACFKSAHTSEICSSMPPGVIDDIETDWVESLPIVLDDTSCYLIGRVDTLVKWEDGTYGVIDFKTASVKEENLAKYSRQLHAYAYALEHSTGRKLTRKPVTRLGLVVYEPDLFEKEGEGRSKLSGKLAWQEITLDRRRFMDFLKEVIEILEKNDPPPPASSCAFCAYHGLGK